MEKVENGEGFCDEDFVFVSSKKKVSREDLRMYKNSVLCPDLDRNTLMMVILKGL